MRRFFAFLAVLVFTCLGCGAAMVQIPQGNFDLAYADRHASRMLAKTNLNAFCLSEKPILDTASCYAMQAQVAKADKDDTEERALSSDQGRGYADGLALTTIARVKVNQWCSGSKPKLDTRSCLDAQSYITQLEQLDPAARQAIIDAQNKKQIDAEKLQQYATIAAKIAGIVALGGIGL